MAEDKKTSWRDLFVSPPVIGAIISSTVAVMLFVVPRLLDDSATNPVPVAEPIPTQAAVAALPSPTEAEAALEIPTELATSTTIPEPTTVPPTMTVPPTITAPTATDVVAPTATTPPTNTASPPANVLLLFDDVAFTLYNQSSDTLSISNMSFRSVNGRWDGSQWGNVAASLPPDNCLRMRDTTSGQRQPPAICSNLYGFQEVGGSALFWLDVESFEVLNGSTVIATCPTAEGSCAVYVEP